MNNECLNCGIAAVLFVLVYFGLLWRAASKAKLGIEIEGVGFVELKEPEKPSQRARRK